MLISEMLIEANCLEEEKHGSWTGARRSDGSRRRLRIWCLALSFKWYRDNVPRFPGTPRTLHLYLFSSELWLARPLFCPAQLIPSVSHPRHPSCPPPNPLQVGRLTPSPSPKIDNPFGHHVCPGPTLLLPGIFSISLIFSGIHGLHNPVPVMTEHLPSFMCLFGNVVVIPFTQCMDDKQRKQSVSVYSRV